MAQDGEFARKRKMDAIGALKWANWGAFLPVFKLISLILVDSYIRKSANPFSFRDIFRGVGFFGKLKMELKLCWKTSCGQNCDVGRTRG
jgi:hypothetical protein